MFFIETDSALLAPLRVIGVGSPFGADRLGWETVQLLQRRPVLASLQPACLSLLQLDRPGAALLDYLSGAEEVIILDAMKNGGRPGQLLRLTGEAVGQAPVKLSSHGFGLRETLNLARVLGESPGQTWLMGIEVGEQEHYLPGGWVERLAKAVEAEILSRCQAVPRPV